MAFRVAHVALVGALSHALAPAMLAAQTPGTIQTARPGTLATRIRSVSNPSQSYALYLPSSYDTTRLWPVLFVMDPGGGALAPMAKFRPAAEKYGYIVISSYNTVSDGPVLPNLVAINAMIADVRSALRADTHRYYLVGFSGTARNAWDFASELNGPVAGIFGAGASGMTLSGDSMPVRPALSFFGTSGVYDFNYEEMRAYEVYLRDTGVPHRIRYFADGGHQWPPDSLVMQGVEYFQLRAMKRGMIPTDSAFVASQFAADSTRARAAEQTKHFEEALNRWREIDREYSGASYARLSKNEVMRLTDDTRVAKDIERRRAFADAYLENRARLAAWLLNSKNATQAVDIKRAIKDLRIDKLKKDASSSKDSDAADAAQRSLADMFAQLSFYYPREALRAGNKARALSYLDIAEIVRPGATLRSALRAEASQ